jgi:SOS-response transcriptional repressor LexA
MKSIDEIRRENLALLRSELGGSLRDLAARLERDESQVSQWMQGSKNSGTGKPRGMRSDTARYIEQRANKPAGWLDRDHSGATNVSPGPDIRGTVPLLSSVQAGAFKEILDSDYSGGNGVAMIPTTVPVNRYTFALRVQGDSMEPKFTEGMLLIVEPELDAQHGDYVIAKNGSDEAVFKQLVKDGADFYLKPLNGRYPIKPLGDCTIIGVVRGVSEMFR